MRPTVATRSVSADHPVFHSVPATPAEWLSDSEITDLCRGLRQNSARFRFLQKLGVPAARRPDGSVLVMRCSLSNNPKGLFSKRQQADSSSNIPTWSKSL